MSIIEEEAAVETEDVVIFNNEAVNTPSDAAVDDAVVVADFSDGFLKTYFTTGDGAGGSEKALLLRSEETEPSLERLLGAERQSLRTAGPGPLAEKRVCCCIEEWPDLGEEWPLVTRALGPSTGGA
ncbi:hypothetical protein NDU88_011997 [Pleurodeles waltl]|uniref:Uncharacterized protein n=1 Tax=Pleurodeles waltl TaxID=8319 RepID=A0AAV7R212_PLEWA|nr:hypothetical protein NDU88_011997 [Pleurodeles waltl]